MSGFKYCLLTCMHFSQEAGKVVWYSHFFKNFPQFVMIHTVKGFGIVKKAEVDVFSLTLLLYDPVDVGNLISGLLPFLNPDWMSGSSPFTYCWSLAWRILSIALPACEMSAAVHSLSILWRCLSLGLERNLSFSSPVATAEFFKFAGILSVALSQHHLLGFETAQLELHHFHRLC